MIARVLSLLAALLVAAGATALPPGFPQAITAAGNDLALWGRTYVFDTACGPFPKATGVVSSCAVKLDGATLAWSDPTLVSNTGELATLTTTASQGNFGVSATTKVDVAGIATIDLTVTNRSGGSDAFSWKPEITLASTLDVYLRRHIEYDAATLTVLKGDTSTFFGSYANDCFSFSPSFEVGDHAKTFEWILDGDYDYLPANRATGCAGAECEPICTADAAGSPVMSVEPFSSTNRKSLAPSASWTEKYLVVVHPTRPNLDDWRGLQQTNNAQINGPSFSGGFFRAESLTGKRFFTLVFPGVKVGGGHAIAQHSGHHRFLDTQAFADHVAANQLDSIETLTYGAATRSAYLHPKYLEQRNDWASGRGGRDGLDFTANFGAEIDGNTGYAKRTHKNVDGDPWQEPWLPPFLAGPKAIAAACKGVGEPWKCCTGPRTGSGCRRADMAVGYHSGCDDEQDGNDEFQLKWSEALSTFLDPRARLDGFYHDFGNMMRSCVGDPRITHPSQQAFFYHNLIEYYDHLYRGTQANGGPMIVSTRPAHPINVIHTTGAPRILAAYTDVLSFGETLGDEFGTVNGGGSGFSGCQDGACNDGTEACTPWDGGVAATCTGVDRPSPCCTGVRTATPQTGCGFCPDYVGLGEDTIVAIAKPNSGGITSSMLAMARDASVNDRDSSSYWARNIWTTWLGVGITHGVASGFAQEIVAGCSGGSSPCQNISRQHHSILDDFGSVLDEDLRATYAHENSPAYSTTGGIRVSIYAHPSMRDCVAECSKKAILIVQNWTNANITGAGITISDHAALGLTEGENNVNCIRTWDPSRVTDTSTATTAQWGSWTSDTSPFTGLSVAAKSYIAIEARYAARCR